MAEYVELFPDDGVLRGDWSPRYMPNMMVPQIALEVLKPDAPLFVLLRDPIDRFSSAMRYAKSLKRIKNDYEERAIIRGHQFGQYASNLEGWSAIFPKERFVILTYEEVRDDVEAACKVFWGALGVDPHRLKDPYGRVKRPTEGKIDWEWPAGMREALIRHYLPQVRWLGDHWGVEVHRWRNFKELL